MKKSELNRIEELAKRDDWHVMLVGSDIRSLVAEIKRLQEYEWMYKDLCK